jgi:Rad3-related DNA helicase
MEEYKESHFCRECGKLLTLGNKVHRANIMERSEVGTTESPGLFPYKPYPQQREFMRDIERVVGNGGVLVTEACNGFGKTACSLASTLPMNHKIIYATRTHEQVRQVLLEVERINRYANTRFSAVNLASRRHLCLNQKCRGLPAVEAYEACRLMRDTNRCRYKWKLKLLPTSLPPVLSMKKLRIYGERHGICPYFLARKVAEKCTVVVGPYQYVFNEFIRARINLQLGDKILIFDEAHNADKISQEVLSDTLSERSLNRSREETELVKAPSDFIDDLAEYLEKNVSDEAKAKHGTEFRKELERVLNVEDISLLTESFSDVVEEIRTHKTERGDYPVCFLNGVLRFLSLVASSPSDSYVAVYRRAFAGFNLVEYKCLDPSLATKPIIEEAYGALIMSGTLSPTRLFTEIMGLPDAETKTYTAIANPENVRTILDASVTTKFAERSEKMILRYGEEVLKLAPRIPNGVLVFFPQRGFMLKSLRIWREREIIMRHRGKLLLDGKAVFIEGSQARENRKIVEEYKRAAKSQQGAVLCGVFRGRNAEGSNFPYKQARGIFLIGVPYADYSDPVVRAQIDYFNRKSKGLGEKWYVMDAFRAANQAMGRGIRHRDDWCNFILMDRRYGTHRKLITPWAVVNGLREVSI